MKDIVAHSPSCWTCWQTSVWVAWPKDSRRFDGWASTVSLSITIYATVGLIHEATSYYEGHTMEQVTFPIRVFKLLGVETIVCKL